MSHRIVVAVAVCGLSLGALTVAPKAVAEPTVTLPPMTSTGSGPMIAGPGAAPGLSQQLTGLNNPNVQEVDGSDAAQFIIAAASVTDPQLAAPFVLLHRALACQGNGAGSGPPFGARAYRRADGLWGGAMLVAAKSATANVDALVSCVKTNWRRSTAGGESAMCNNGWTTPTDGDLRRTEVYYILLAGTAADFCTGLNARYATNASGWP
ncbi:hypothetical protein [Mycobacterium pseudokansasii]|uniref:Secreted protein n=1 Tax=Mycobacterium pseudokansasii TaxID=2341080 RepID=A0A498QMP4_9MYCO|nr:hypothetical protein [Mycobacterium pseudokansasii]VAZ88846.1 hypothetical protein LAUMK35_00689 [Mycobacterium pseudokansasii]VAZ89360.1 hypothetical protein LAUMK21_00687 [Mycobacterium pseudokansasii]VBA46993.1 hypothetical protein LAUMK142_00565 [Mycobacterium pseudokansasii]